MDNKQLFKQSAGKILSRNQLEGVMRLHNAIFEGVSPEQVADSVADAVKDAVEDSLDSIADQQVADDVSEASPITVSPEDQIRLESLIGSMSDDEMVAFFESLDDQQVQILTEGLGSWIGSGIKRLFNVFTKNGRKINRRNRFNNLSMKDAELTRQLDNFRNQNDLSQKAAKKLDKLMAKRAKTRQKMNDVKLKASKDQAEFDQLEQDALKNGSRNVRQETMEAERARLLNDRDNAINTVEQRYRPRLDELERQEAQRLQELDDSEKALKDLLEQDRKAPGTVPYFQMKNAKDRVTTARRNVTRNRTDYNDAQAKYNAERAAINQSFDPQIKDMDNRINMSRQDAGGFTYGTNSARFNNANVGGAAAGANAANRGMNGQFNNPFANPYLYPDMWKQFTRRFSTMGKISTAMIGSWHAFKAALGLGAIGALGYGGYKVYDFFTKPQELDMNIGDADGRIPKNAQIVIGLLAGGIGGRVVAKFLGFNSTTGKNVASLLGAVLVAYFMFLNNGDEENAKEMLAEYNNASSTDKKAIEEALDFEGLGEQLKQAYLENSSL